MVFPVLMNLFISNFKRLPLAFLISIAFTIFFQYVIFSLPPVNKFIYFFGRPGRDDILRSKALLSEIPDGENLIIGDSTAQEDTDVFLLNILAKDNFYKLGASANTPTEINFLKEEYFNKKPSTIIYVTLFGSYYLELSDKERTYVFKPAIIKDLYNIGGLNAVMAQKTFLVKELLGEAFPFYKYNQKLVSIIDIGLNEWLVTGIRTGPKNYTLSGVMTDEQLAKELDYYGDDFFHFNPFTDLHKRSFIEFAKKARDEDVRLIVVEAPVRERLMADYRANLVNDFNDFMNSKSKSIGFEYIDKNLLPSFYENDFHDLTHLNKEGRDKFTNFLASYLLEADIVNVSDH